jgi:hypothetical protein
MLLEHGGTVHQPKKHWVDGRPARELASRNNAKRVGRTLGWGRSKERKHRVERKHASPPMLPLAM